MKVLNTEDLQLLKTAAQEFRASAGSLPPSEADEIRKDADRLDKLIDDLSGAFRRPSISRLALAATVMPAVLSPAGVGTSGWQDDAAFRAVSLADALIKEDLRVS